MSDPLSHCLNRLHLQDDNKLKQRAQQFQGQLSSLPNKLFDKGPNLKVVIGIQLAYESLQNLGWDVKLAGQLSGCTASAYETCLSKVRQHLNIQPTVTFDTLLVALGSTTMSKPVKELWDDFTELYIEQFKGARKINAQKELESPYWKGAVVFSCARAFGNAINKDKLHSLCGCSTAELNKSIKTVQTTSSKKLADLKNTTTTTKRGKTAVTDEQETTTEKKKSRKRRHVETEEQEPKPVPRKPISGIVSMIYQEDYKNTKRYADYVDWRSNLIKLLKS